MNNSTVNFTTPEESTNSSKVLNNLEMCMFTINFLFGLPTQSYVIWLIITGTGSGIVSEFFFLNLSVCEIFNCLDCLMFILTNWCSGLMALSLFLQGLIIAGRPLFQCLICVERYLAVVHPVTFLKFKPLRYKVICCTAAWIISLWSCLFCMISLMLNGIIAHSFFFSILFLLFFSIQLFCLLAVLRALKQSGPGERGREREEENHIKKRAFYLILITTVTTVMIYMPMSISGFITIVTEKYISEFWFPALICYVLGGFVQPVLYFHRGGKLCFAPSC